MHSVTAEYNEFCAQRWRYDSMYSLLLFKHSFLEIFSRYKLCVENMNCRNQSMKITLYVQVFYHAWRVGTFMLGKQDFSLCVWLEFYLVTALQIKIKSPKIEYTFRTFKIALLKNIINIVKFYATFVT